MKKMIWHHNGSKEIVVLFGVSVRPATAGFDNTTYATIMDARENYHVVPLSQLKMTTEDYNKYFAE